MKLEKCIKSSFVVIGKEGSTLDGSGFIQKLWNDANEHFQEIESLVKRNEKGELVGIWGVMSDFDHTFQPWKDFKEGLYLAGVECQDDVAPDGWVKWVIPSYEYLYTELKDQNTFSKVIQYMKENHLSLVGAAHDFTCPQTKKNYIFFPIRKIDE